MESSIILPTVFRWLHIGPVILAIGGSFFLRFVLIPSVEQVLDQEAHDKLRVAMTARWKKIVHACIGLILLSGFFNIWYALTVLDKGGLYGLLFLVKVFAAFGVFFIASALVGQSEAFHRMRADRKKWLAVLLVLAGIIVIISGAMKNLPSKASHDQDSVTSTSPVDNAGSA